MLTLAMAENEMYNESIGEGGDAIERLQKYDSDNRNSILKGLPELPPNVLKQLIDPDLLPHHDYQFEDETT